MRANHYDILFTGGLDSTYRLCQLALDEKVTIQPIYIMFPDNGKSPCVRPELQNEVNAQNKILEYIINHPNTKAKILPIKRIQRDEIPVDVRIFDTTEVLCEIGLAWQYQYIAAYAKWNVGVELCIESTFNKFLRVNNYKTYVIEGHRFLDVSCLNDKLAILFKDVSWPIVGTTRDTMVSNLKNWGFSDIFSMITFCYQTVNGEPCGVCDNCISKITQGLTFLFPKKSLLRYLIYTCACVNMPPGVNDIYRKYVYKSYDFNGPNFFNSEEYYSDFRWINRFHKMEQLSFPVLQKMIIEGSSRFNDTPYQRKKRILLKRKDVVHRKFYEELFTKF